MAHQDRTPSFRNPASPVPEAQVDRGGGDSNDHAVRELVARLGVGPGAPRAALALRAALDRQRTTSLKLSADLENTQSALLEQLEERSRLERIIATAPDAILTIGADNRVLLFNAAAERMFRCAATEAIGLPVGTFIPARMPRVADGGMPQGACPHGRVGAEPSQVTVQAVRQDGDRFLAEITVSETEDSTEPLHTLVVRDVTLRKSAEEALCRLSSAVEQTGDGICITDSRGVIEYVNPAFERLTGFARTEMIGHRPTKFRSGLHDPGFYEGLWETVLAGEVFRRVFIDRKSDGEVIHLDETITPLTDAEGRITHFVAVARDVTPRIRTEEALRRMNEHLEEQAKAIAQSLHDEAGQLLTAAHIALADAGHDLPDRARERLQGVRHHLDRIEVELRRVAHDLRPPVLDDMGLLGALAVLAEGVERRWGVPVAVEGDVEARLPGHVESAVYRLVQEALTNVTKHAQASRASVRLDRRPGLLRCTIADDGVGFDTAASPKGQARPGMGLRGVRDRVEALGGTLDIRSAPGRGSTLAITIPLER